MRIKNGKVKLDPNEKRVGNFVIKDESEHVKVMDLGGVFTHRASKRTPVGLFLKGAFDDLSDRQAHEGLANWFAVLFTLFSVVPDPEFLSAAFEAARSCIERHPEAYGEVASPGDDAENARVEDEMREMMQFEQEIKTLSDETDAPEPGA